MKIDTIKAHELLKQQNENKWSSSLKPGAINKPMHQTFSGLTIGARQILLSAFNQSNDCTDKELLTMLDGCFNLESEYNMLKSERATLSIDGFISKGIVDPSQRETYIKLATNNYEITLEIITNQHSSTLELECLLMLSGDELYMTGKLERLKELSPAIFQEKHKQIFGVEFKSKN